MNRAYFFLLIFHLMVYLSSAGCAGSKEKVMIRDGAGNLVEQYETTGDSIRDGVSEKFDAEGNLASRQEYRNGILHGERLIFDGGGQIQVREQYQNGEFEGPYQYYYPSGQVEMEGTYRSNVMVGDWKRYYENGQLREIVHFEDNQENGPFVEYYENGKMKAEGQYYHGDNEHGLLKLYDESGDLYRKMECDSGKCHTIWKRDDQD